MFSLEPGVRYFMYTRPVNMRKGVDSLFALVRSRSPLSPTSGDVFVFFSRDRRSVKMLRWDADGFVLYQKRLERGTFEMPLPAPSSPAGYRELAWETFSLIMSGVSLDSVRFRERFLARPAGR